MQCSFSVCLKKPEQNQKAVEKYAERWRKLGDSTFDCYYNSKNNRDVIIQKKHTKEDVIHSMVWPCVVIMICGIIFLRLEMRRRNLAFCGPSEIVRGEAEGAEDLKNANKSMLEQHWHANSEQCKINCKLIKCRDTHSGVLSSSLSSLDRISKTDPHHKQSQTNGRIGTSMSVDTLKHHTVTSGGGGEISPIVNKYTHLSGYSRPKKPQDIEIMVESPSGSQGSRIMGLETPV